MVSRSLKNIFKESFWMAIDAIRQNKLRSILTLLGISIGVFSVIGVMTAIRTLESSVQSGLNVFATNTFVIQKYPEIQFGHGRGKYRNRKNIDYDQGKNLKIYRENKINLWIIRWYSKLIIKIINPIKQKFILDNNNQKDFQLIKYNRYVIINDYIKYLVSFIYLITIFIIFSFIKKYSIIFRENYK